MTPKQRFIAALDRKQPDRLPVTTHHVMGYFLGKYMNDITIPEFFDSMGLDPILWTVPHKADESAGFFYEPGQGDPGFMGSRRVASDQWIISAEQIGDTAYTSERYTVNTPGGNLSCTLQSNTYTSWLTEYIVKDKTDIDLIAEFATYPLCDVDAVNRQADGLAERGLVRGHICAFDVYGQPGTWQDACCLRGTEQLIMDTFDDPTWVHEFLQILLRRKLSFVESLKGAKYDVLELGGGDASSTVISPDIFEKFVAPYDAQIIEKAHNAGQRIAYHTCGGMMPILDLIASMNPDAMETFTPSGMGGDVDLAEAKKRIGSKVCMIGGFDQGAFFSGCTEEETRSAVRHCFESAGDGGGFILAPSDHFFDSNPDLIKAFADEARKCTYS